MRVYTKIGDVFSVKIDEHTKKYFQYIASDLTQLNSDVIRAFKQTYPIGSKPVLAEIVKGDVEFYAHCVAKIGIKMGYWEKIGNISEVGKLDHILFKDTDDYGDPQIKLSQKWWVWKINEPAERVGLLVGENRKAEVGLVMDPESIVHRMRTGQYRFRSYPD